jgi:AraC family transcriptional regulator
MLRYVASGKKDLDSAPIVVSVRFNWEFYANLEGQLRPKLQASAPPYTKPTLYLFPPDMIHGWEAEAPVERVVFHFSTVPDIIRDYCRERGYLQTALQPGDIPMLRELAHSMEEHYRAPTPASLLIFQRALLDLSLLLIRGTKFSTNMPLETLPFERVNRVIEWYLDRLEERPTLEALAEVVHVSPAHLRRQFKLVYGKSPHVVLTQLRLEKAAQLLATCDDKLEVVARQSGFNSASDFCRVFHRRFGVYPNVWRTYISGAEQAEREKQLQRLIARSGSASPLQAPEPVSAQVASRPKSAPKRTKKRSA